MEDMEQYRITEPLGELDPTIRGQILFQRRQSNDLWDRLMSRIGSDMKSVDEIIVNQLLRNYIENTSGKGDGPDSRHRG